MQATGVTAGFPPVVEFATGGTGRGAGETVRDRGETVRGGGETVHGEGEGDSPDQACVVLDARKNLEWQCDVTCSGRKCIYILCYHNSPCNPSTTWKVQPKHLRVGLRLVWKKCS